MTLVLILCVYTLIFAGISLTQINFLKKQREQKAVILDEKAYKEAADIAIANEKFSIFSHLYLFMFKFYFNFFIFTFLSNTSSSRFQKQDITCFLIVSTQLFHLS